jgi:general secretion pathway protein G
MHKFERNKIGFTLIELMVAIAIIGILSASLTPQIMGLLDKAKLARAQSDIRAISTAVLVYIDDNNGQYPGGNTIKQWDAQTLNSYLFASGGGKRYLQKAIANDPWNTAYRFFSCRDYTSGHSFIMSRGPDKGCSAGLAWGTTPSGDDLAIWIR